ncbi:cystinosin homolog [Bradysia coprophila]|uniref:cystinosin homolog n=1 Tax=Bradysia coprophila TaxID=38358 RepID=UPI00187DA278|nr:cystinosin homolog [Bradysia coprophila]
MAILPRIAMTFLMVLSAEVHSQELLLSMTPQDMTVLVDEVRYVDIKVGNGVVNQNATIIFEREHPHLIDVVPSFIEIYSDGPREFMITVLGKSPGHSLVTTNITENTVINESDLFLRVTIAVSSPLIVISEVVGWIYFAAWSVSFYPQIYINFSRRSVVGYSFDYASLNIVGFVMYSAFNCGLFWNKYIQAEYFQRFPQGLNPVLINDVVFALHAVVATIVIIIQCCVYERGEQRVSILARIILGVYGICTIVMAILGGVNVVHWLDFLYYCSYVKLSITIMKYIPQAVLNYRRKSTVGWSIENILLDFTGGMLSMLQMLLNGYNYDDWVSIFGDPTKFGLGLFSVCFDILFMVQHYGLYRHSRKTVKKDENVIESDNKVEE